MTPSEAPDAYDLSDIRAEEARMLRARSFSSARVVMVVVFLAAIAISVTGPFEAVALWIVLASVMVGVTLVYARLVWAGGIPEGQDTVYLRGHVVVTATTGLVWGGFAIWFADPVDELRTFVGALLLTSISAGGALSGTVYRPGYLALITTSVLPFGIYLLAFGEGAVGVFGYFILFYFVMCNVTNERLNHRTRQDIVARLGRDAGRKIFEQSAEIERLYAQKTRFMANISHDMTQPMLAQRHLVRTLMGQLEKPEDLALLRQIENTQASQERLVQELAELGQAQAQASSPDPEHIDLAPLFDQLRAEFLTRAQDRDMMIICEAESPDANVDRHFVERILRNLLSNAVKYAGGGAQIILSAHKTGSTLEIAVKDNGPGIAAKDLDTVFDEYVRLDDVQGQDGSGLGLAISRRLAGQLGGSLELFSTPGEGTRAVLSLPVDPARANRADSFAIVIGREVSPDLGPWANLFSGWMWGFAHCEDVDAARKLLKTLGIVPGVVLFDPPPSSVGDVVAMQKIAPVHVIGTTAEALASGVTNLPEPVTAKGLRAALDELLV